MPVSGLPPMFRKTTSPKMEGGVRGTGNLHHDARLLCRGRRRGKGSVNNTGYDSSRTNPLKTHTAILLGLRYKFCDSRFANQRVPACFFAPFENVRGSELRSNEY